MILYFPFKYTFRWSCHPVHTFAMAVLIEFEIILEDFCELGLKKKFDIYN